MINMGMMISRMKEIIVSVVAILVRPLIAHGAKPIIERLQHDHRNQGYSDDAR